MDYGFLAIGHYTFFSPEIENCVFDGLVDSISPVSGMMVGIRLEGIDEGARMMAEIDNTTVRDCGINGIEIIRRAVSAPIKQIAENCGLEGAIVCQKVEEADKNNFGFNALTQQYGDLVKDGVIVPTKVERIALQNAASISGLLLTTDAAIVEIKEKKEKAPAGGGGMDDFDY